MQKSTNVNMRARTIYNLTKTAISRQDEKIIKKFLKNA